LFFFTRSIATQFVGVRRCFPQYASGVPNCLKDYVFLYISFLGEFMATFTVTNNSDNGDGSLRQAILATNAIGASANR
jgi:hypothetical protein